MRIDDLVTPEELVAEYAKHDVSPEQLFTAIASKAVAHLITGDTAVAQWGVELCGKVARLMTPEQWEGLRYSITSTLQSIDPESPATTNIILEN